MKNKTLEFIEALKNLSNNDEINVRVTNEVEVMKGTLQTKGYKFYTEEHTDDLVGGQGIINRDVDLVEHYKEIAYIKRGTTTEEWVSMLNEKQRYDEIRGAMEDILET